MQAARKPEWAINTDGKVLLTVPGALDQEPVRAELTATGRLVVALRGGGQQVFTPNRKVASALRQQDSLLIAEARENTATGGVEVTRATWVSSQRPSFASPMMRAR